MAGAGAVGKAELVAARDGAAEGHEHDVRAPLQRAPLCGLFTTLGVTSSVT